MAAAASIPTQSGGSARIQPATDGGQMGPFQGHGGQMVQSQETPTQGYEGHMARFQGYGNAAMPALGMGNHQVSYLTNTALLIVCSTTSAVPAVHLLYCLHPTEAANCIPAVFG